MFLVFIYGFSGGRCTLKSTPTLIIFIFFIGFCWVCPHLSPKLVLRKNVILGIQEKRDVSQ